MSEIDRIEVAITADPSSAVSGFQKASQAAQDFDSKIKSVGSSDFGDKVQGESEQAVTGLKKAEDAADSLSSKLKNLDIGSGLSGISKISGGLADGMQKVGLAATAVGVPVGLLAKNSISMFADLESQTQRNTALLGGAKAEYEEILALSKELGASTPFDALEIGAGIESLAAAGYSLNEIKSAMPTVAEMAIATGEDLSSMSEILIATLSSYGEGADKAAMYGDKLATVANISSAGIGDFGESMKYVGAVANAFGVDIDELGASIATLADNNLKGSLAGTGLREIITTLVNPTAKVKDIFESFGLTMDELNPKTNDFVDIMKKMKDANVSSEAMMAAFGDRAGPAAVILLEQIDKLKENYSTLLTESDGMLKEFSGKMRDTLGFVMDEMGGTIGNIMIEIGAGLKPIVQEMGKWLNENQQTLIDFAKNAVEGLTPFVEKFLGLAEKLMDWFNGLPKDMQSKIAGLTGLGAAMATIGGPLLLLGSIPVRAVSDITGALSGLFTVAKGASGAGLGGLAGEISGLGGAAGGALPNLTALLGPAGILAVGLGAGALAAYATNFGDFRDNVNEIISDIGRAGSNIQTGNYKEAGRACGDAFVGGLESVADLVGGVLDPDTWIAVGDFVTGLGEAIEEGLEGFGASLTAAGIDVGGRLMEAIGDGAGAATSALSSMGGYIMESVMSGINNPGAVADMICDGINNASVNISSFVQNLESQILKGNWGEIGASAAQLVVDAFKVVNPVVGALAQGGLDEINGKNGTTTGTTQASGLGLANKPGWVDPHSAYASYQENKALLSDASDVISKLAEEKDISYESAKKMYDSSENLRKSLEMKYTEQPAGTPSDPITITAPVSTPTTASVVATSVSTGTFERPSGNIPDLFTRDPARYFENAINPFIEGWAGSVEVYEDYLKESGKSLEDKAREIFYDAKSNGFGGGVNWDDWWSDASKSFDKTGTEAKSTTPQINTLNSAFEKIGVTGSGLTDVLSNVNQALSDHHANIQESQDYLKQYNDVAGENVKYTKDQEVQTKDLMNSIGMLGTAQNMYNTYMQDGVLDATESAHVQESLAAATKMMGEAGITANTNLSGLPGALQALASAAQAAMSQIQSIVAAASAQISNVRKVDDWTLQTMTGLPTIATSTPTNFQFASGGPVTQNGPAMLHQGEYVLRRDEVNRQTSGANVNLNINMSNSRFGNSEMQKDLPKRIARETRRALARSGI